MNKVQARQRRQPRVSRRTAANTKPPPNKFFKAIQRHIPVILGGAVLAGLIIRTCKRANRPEPAQVSPEASNQDIPRPWNLGPALCAIPAVAEFLARQAQLKLPDLNGPQKAVLCPIDDGVGSGIDNGATVAPKPWTKGGNLKALFEAFSSCPLPDTSKSDQADRPEPIEAKPDPVGIQVKPLLKNPTLKDLIEAAIAMHGDPFLGETGEAVQLTAVIPSPGIEEQKAQDGDSIQVGNELVGGEGECHTANQALQEGPPNSGNQVDLLATRPAVGRRCFCLGPETIPHSSKAEGIHAGRLKESGSEPKFKRRPQQHCPPCRESPGRFTSSLASPWRPKMLKWPVSVRPLCCEARGPPVIDT